MKAFEIYWRKRIADEIAIDNNFGSSEYAGDCFTIGKDDQEKGWKASLEHYLSLWDSNEYDPAEILDLMRKELEDE